MSNRIEAMIGMIAVTSIGAIWSGAMPLIGSKLLLDDFLQLGLEADGSVPPMQFEQVSFDHPVFINYTSGTTGLPKAIVHGVCTFNMFHNLFSPFCVFRDFCVHFWALAERQVFGSQTSQVEYVGFEVGEFFSFFSGSTALWWYQKAQKCGVGWVSWNCFAGLLFVGCTSVLLEGSPYFLSPTYFWDMLDEYEITHIFMATSIVDELQRLGYVFQYVISHRSF
ncbi:acetoacetyl-CoA synthetase [Caerostris extrusa]|uniref:Acetoacetyl-CoA synthetase n=1 Tax=Caerostris extrusa TaxID=172846 RepID=A0AAV4SX36_CAEEX|nr:acetoacetyl-CoA synthetase [Caerostris extrusa]